MKELFEDEEKSVGVSEPIEEKHDILKYKKPCSFCGGTENISIWANGIVKCKNCIVRSE